MATQTFNCPNCGAPINYDGSDTSTVKCPFCENSVVVPEALRPPKEPEVQNININLPEVSPSAARVSGGVLALIIGCIVLFTGAMIALPIYLTQKAASEARSALINSPLMEQDTAQAKIPTELALPSATPVPSPTPAYATADLTFGQKGIGPGMLNDARYIAVDGNGKVYVADYQDGRVQVFDSTGKYATQWKVGDDKTILYGLTANHKGEVFVSYDNLLVGVDGATGKQLSKVVAPGGGEYGDLFATADGGLAATWYEARWGIITSLQGHRDDLVMFNAAGKVASTVQSFLSSQTDDVALDTKIAIDGLGNIYALDRGPIYKFSPNGKFLDKFGGSGDQPGALSSPSSIAVDGQGRLFVADSNKILVFLPDGNFVTDFPTGKTVNMIVFDEQGALWGVFEDKVSKFVVTGK